MSTNEGTACAMQVIGTFVGRELMSGLFIWGGCSKLTAAAATKAMFWVAGWRCSLGFRRDLRRWFSACGASRPRWLRI